MPFQSQESRAYRSRHFLHVPLIVLLFAALACALPGVQRETPTPTPTEKSPQVETPLPPVKPTPTPRPLPPALVESDPYPRSEIALDGSITFYFNQPMDRASVEAAFSGLSGTFNWIDDSTLIFTPDEPAPPATELNVSLGTGARATNGMALTEPISLVYQTVGYLRLSQALPEDGATAVDPTSAVVAAFNRPVVPLGADQESLAPAFAIEPPVPGHGEWLNTSTYIFYPEPALAGGEQYTVQLREDLAGLDGSPLEFIESWSFTTELPGLSAFEPEDGARNVRLDANILLTFNQPMDPDSVAGNLQVEDEGGERVSGEVSWNDDFTIATFDPEGLWRRGQQYTVRLGAASRSGGGTPLGAQQEFDFRTVGELAVLSSKPAERGLKDAYSGVLITFSAPVKPQNVLQFITLEPEIPNLEAYVDEEQATLWIYGNFSPETDYTLTISPNLPDAWNGRLGQDFTLHFRTRPLDPNLVVTYGTDVLFVRPEESRLTVQATNLGRLSLSIGRVPVDDFIAMLAPGGFNLRQAYQPEDQQTFSQALDLPANQSTAVDIPLTMGGAPLSPGFYILRFNVGVKYIYPGPYLLIVSSVNTTLKMSAIDALVWAVDLRDGSPLADQPVTIYAETGSVIASGETNRDGLFSAEFPPRRDVYDTAFAIIGEPGEEGFSAALTNWNQGMLGNEFGHPIDYTPPHLEAYLYTDRPIYRPGQTVFFRAIARQAYNGRYDIPDQSSLLVKLFNPLGEEMAAFDLPLSVYGTAHGSYQLPEDLEPGQYYLSSEEANYSSVVFHVAEYRKPEINLSVTFAADQVKGGDPLEATIEARYFFDAPAGDVPLTWILYREPDFFFYPGYEVGRQDTRWLSPFPSFFIPSLGEQVDQGEGQTGPDGRFEIELSTEASDTRYRYRLEVTATDETGLPVSARAEALANPADFFIGVRPDVWFLPAGREAGFEVQVVDWAGDPAGERSLRADFQKVEWELIEPPPGELRQLPTYAPRYTPIDSTDFATGEDSAARVAFTPPEPGTYQLNVSGADPGSELALTEVLLWVGGSGEATWPNLPNQRLRLTADKDSYLPGETAQVFVPNPLGENVQALVTVERGVVFSHQVIAIDGSGTSLSIPLGHDEAPNVYLSVTLLRAGGESGPDFRQGIINLPVEPVAQTLEVTLTSQPQRTGPGEPVTFDLLVTDSRGEPVEGEFSLSVVDLAVLALADPTAPDIVPAFYGIPPLAVNTSLGLAAWTGRELLAPEGLGGGGGDLAPPIEVREEFPDTAYWNAEFTTGADGRATVTVDLPDTLTTWQIDVRGISQDSRVGQAQDQVVTTKDLLVRPVTPRFLVLDDHTLLAAVVQNNTPADLQVTVALEAAGFALDEPDQALQSVAVPAGGRTRVEWWGVALDVASADLVFSATAEGPAGVRLEDAARPAQGALPVLRYVAPQTFGTSGVLENRGERLELVSLPRSFDPAGGSLDVETAPTLGAALLAALDVLEEYPYDSCEIIVSRFLPNLETYRVVQEFGLEDEGLRSRLDRTLEDSLAQLAARQNDNGGWAWGRGGPSDPFITAYVLLGLTRASEAGIDLEAGVIPAGVEYLRAALPAVEMLEETWQFDRLAFELYTIAEARAAGLARGGESDLAIAANLFTGRDRLNPWAQALLALTFENLAPGDERTLTLFSDLEAGASRSATGVHWENKVTSWQNMSSTIQATATVLYALAQHDPASPLVADAMRYLMAHRDASGAWPSTYETAWTLMAAAEVMRGTGELEGSFAFSVELNSALLVTGEATRAAQMTPITATVPISDLYPDDPNALLIERGSGPGRLYYSAHLTVHRPVEEVAPLERGISLSRSYYPSTDACEQAGRADEECPPVEGARAGELVTARLTITVPETAYYLIVEDYIPAGAEVLDTSLKTSQLGAVPEYDPRRPLDEGWGWWYFGEPRVYDDHIAWSAESLPPGTYELTYQLVNLQPGEYRVLPARAWQAYFPEVQGNSAGEVFEIGR